MANIWELLIDIGLTKAEAKAYLALLDLDQETIGPIAKKAGVAYSKIHLLLDKLIEKGLASYIVKEKVRYYSASNPKKIIEYLNKKKEVIDQEINTANSIIAGLQNKIGLNQPKERMEIYEGVEGLSTIYNEGLDSFKDGEEVIVLGASFGKATGGDRVKRFFSAVNKKRIKKKIHYRLIGNESARNDPEAKEWQKLPYTKVRFLLENTPGSINIASDRVMIIYWHKEKPKIFFIKSQPVADSFKQYFEVIWEKAKP